MRAVDLISYQKLTRAAKHTYDFKPQSVFDACFSKLSDCASATERECTQFVLVVESRAQVRKSSRVEEHGEASRGGHRHGMVFRCDYISA